MSHLLDNEISTAMKDLIKDAYKMTPKLVPSGCHHRNDTKVAIATSNHISLAFLLVSPMIFLSDYGTNTTPQVEITLNLLQQSNTTPMVSVYAHLNNPFDYNKMLLAPMDCTSQIHEKTDSRGIWAVHSIDGWYLNTSPEHYRTCCHIKFTNGERLSDTVHFKQKHITNHNLTPAEKLMADIADCSQALKGMVLSKGTSNIDQLQTFLQQASTQLDSAHTTPLLATPRRAPTLPRVEYTSPRVEDPNMRVTVSMAPTITANRKLL